MPTPLDEIRAATEGMTEGPWWWWDNDPPHGSHIGSELGVVATGMILDYGGSVTLDITEEDATGIVALANHREYLLAAAALAEEGEKVIGDAESDGYEKALAAFRAAKRKLENN